MQFSRDRKANRSGNGIVCTLLHVDMVIGVSRLVFAFLAARSDVGKISDDLIRVHVVARACTCLKSIHNKLVVVLFRNDGIGRLNQRIGQLRLQPALLLATAAARLIRAWATIRSRSGGCPEIGKLSRARAV